MAFSNILGGGFKHFLCSSLFGERSNLTNIFQMGWFNHQLATFMVDLSIAMYSFLLGG